MAGSTSSGPSDESAIDCDASDHIMDVKPIAPSPRPIRAVSFLEAGRAFSGSQTVNKPLPQQRALPTPASSTAPGVPYSKDMDEWRVNVVIQGVDLRRGTICGSMEALDVPKADSPVVTFWTGEIIDNINHFFRTRRWLVPLEKDVEHWKHFLAFCPFQPAVHSDSLHRVDLSQHRYIFMRWKELFFASPGEECGLTIAGFYYVCMDRHTGSILGFYYDPECQPFQRLQLNAVSTRNGFALGEYAFN